MRREQFVDDEVLFVGEVGQVGAAMVGRLGQPLDQPGQLLHRGVG